MAESQSLPCSSPGRNKARLELKNAKFYLLQKAENQTDFQELQKHVPHCATAEWRWSYVRSGCTGVHDWVSLEQQQQHTSTSAVDCSSIVFSHLSLNQGRVDSIVASVPSRFSLTLASKGARNRLAGPGGSSEVGRIRLISDGAAGNERARVLQGKSRRDSIH